MTAKKDEINAQLSQLQEIVQWFEEQKEIDVEKGLDKVKAGASLIKELKTKLKKAENEFKEIKDSLESEELDF